MLWSSSNFTTYGSFGWGTTGDVAALRPDLLNLPTASRSLSIARLAVRDCTRRMTRFTERALKTESGALPCGCMPADSNEGCGVQHVRHGHCHAE
jgi:hypothetical protein